MHFDQVTVNGVNSNRNTTVYSNKEIEPSLAGNPYHYKIPKSEMVLFGSQKLQDNKLILVFVNKISATLLAEQLFVEVGCKGGLR